ncbi:MULTISPECIES: RNA-guided endonuclease InsQ/TnpB family protein [unclassified Coleofasciculus]|uniref:RNA-guided endonuclease InsQ/TnpB family protein n=1 Tax=unclassified Coleofasciculus TaxID=2692782 RepID=UPI00187E7041|nr:MULTISPECIES: zinc ribbon domain-containing protein [unclassified Coleofasciculus]MBE9127408.1 transposase [Coleofasciculus sp. LEGE 07081]MBE9147166.1 transposase [Coleofasciculus sp. LEGE 07092]
MLTITHRYRIYPDATQKQQFIDWMEVCRGAFNYALREIKDWCNSRKCLIDRCSLEKEYILPAELKFPSEIQQLNNLPRAKKEFPRLSEVPSQVLQQAIKQLHKAWEYFQKRGFGFPRFKKYGQFKSLLFPQFKENPVPNLHVLLPKIGTIPINLHRPIPTGFVVKQVRILRKADRWYAWKRGNFFGEVDARGTSQECPECGGEVRKDLSVRIHNCPHCGYKTDRDVAAGQNIRNRGIKLISTVGQTGKETACADVLPGAEETQSRQVSKSPERSAALSLPKGRRGVTRKPKK